MRLDKWLWCARFFKTRTLAAAAIKNSRIKLNDNNIKAAKNIRIGDKLEIHKSPFKYSITILKLSHNRLPTHQAILLYEEKPQSIEERQLLIQQLKTASISFPKTRGRPTKRDRRQIIRFTQTYQNDD